MKNLRQISINSRDNLGLVFTSQVSSLWKPYKLHSFKEAFSFLKFAFKHEFKLVENVDIYITTRPLYHDENIVYSTLVHSGEEIGNFFIHDGEQFIPFQVNADAPIIVVNGAQENDGVQLSIVHEVSHLLDEEPNSGSHNYMDSPREQRARGAEKAFLNWLGKADEDSSAQLQSRYQDGSDMQL